MILSPNRAIRICRVLSTRGVLGYRIVMMNESGQDLGWLTFIRAQDGLTIEELQVAREHRQQGIAETLVQLVLDAASHVELQVDASNATARRLYARLGFQQTGIRYAPDGETMLILKHATAEAA